MKKRLAYVALSAIFAAAALAGPVSAAKSVTSQPTPAADTGGHHSGGGGHFRM